MVNYPSYVKDKLTSIIKEMAVSPELFVKSPGRDFTRNRKLTFESVIQLLLSMGGNSIYKELLDYYKYDIDTTSSSAFIQQREKILPFALEFLLNEFTNSFNNYKIHKGYKLFAVDGSDLNIAHNPNDSDTYFQSSPDKKGFNLLHLLYIDVCIQSGRKENEYRALTDMVDRSTVDGNML